jgi:hypothetical protein
MVPPSAYSLLSSLAHRRFGTPLLAASGMTVALCENL